MKTPPAAKASGTVRRLLGILAATSMIVVVLTSCSNSPTASSAGGGSSNYARAVTYAQCMRSHGIPNWPDPNSQGQFMVTGNLGSQAALQSARNACAHLLPNGGQGPGGQQQKAADQMLKYSACMRTHGLTDFPDPVSVNGGVSFHLPADINIRSPRFQAAQRACGSLAPGGGS